MKNLNSLRDKAYQCAVAGSVSFSVSEMSL